IQAYQRDSLGGLKPLTGPGSCISDAGTGPLGDGTCVSGRGLYDVGRVVLSANKQFIYTNSFNFPSDIAVVNRNAKTGRLSQRHGTAACMSANGTAGDSSLHCRVGRALGGGNAGALSPMGNTLYFAEVDGGSGDIGALVIFRVSTTGGGFSQLSGKLGCVTHDGSDNGSPGLCEKARAIEGAYQVAISASGQYVYVASSHEN